MDQKTLEQLRKKYPCEIKECEGCFTGDCMHGINWPVAYEALEKLMSDVGKSNEKLTAELVCLRGNMTELRQHKREKFAIEEIKTGVREVMQEIEQSKNPDSDLCPGCDKRS